MNKVIAILGIVCALAFFCFSGYLVYKNNTLNAQVARLKEDLANRDTLIEVQNKAIEQNKLDIENYKANKKASDTKIFTKYENVYITDSNCEAELKSIKDLLATFYAP